MKKLLSSLFLTCSLFFTLHSDPCCNLLPSPSFYCGNFYLGGFGGYNWLTQSKVTRFTVFDERFNSSRSFRPGWIGGGNIGYAWDNGIHLEMEVSVRNNRRKGEQNTVRRHATTALMANGFYQFYFDCFLPEFFIGGGVGYTKARDSYEGSDFVKKRDGFAWQALCGIAYPAFNHLDLDLTYRFFNESQGSFTHSSLDLGFRYLF